MSKKIMVLGAGYAGIEAALTLYKKKKRNDIEITVIDKNPYHTLLTELHEVAGNRISEDGVIVPLKDIFKYTEVKVVQDEISTFDFEKNKIFSNTTEYNYDYLVFAAGSQPNYYGIPGMEENCFPLWSYQDAVNIREHIKNCFLKASKEKDAAKRKALTTFIVGGGGFTGVEMVGELAQWSKSLSEEYGIRQSDIRIILIEALSSILSNLKPKSISKTMNYLTKKLKVEVLTGCPITKLNENSVELKNGTVIPSNTLIWTAGVKASCITDDISLEKGKACRIQVNEFVQTQYSNVYAVGDISCFIDNGSTLPALVESALQTGKAAANNILADIRGTEKQKLKPKLHGVMVSVGSFFAVSDIMGKQLPVLISILMKYMVNVHYLFGIGGFELVLKYLKHEFLNKQQKKFLLEKHYSASTLAFWLVPIRIFLGISWFLEGLNKINEGWLSKPMLAKMIDTTSSASEATAAPESVFKLSFPLYTWFFENVIVPNSVIFQTIIIFSEMLLGIALITGTLTFISGLVSLGLNISFIFSTGMYTRELWYLFAAVTVLGGAGKAFGVDHYLIPYLMRQWRFFVRNRKIKLWLFK